MVYRTKFALRQAVERRRGACLQDDTWQAVVPEKPPPYDGADLEETLGYLPPLHGGTVKWWRQLLRNQVLLKLETRFYVEPPRRFLPWAQEFRKDLGLDSPIPSYQLAERLVLLGGERHGHNTRDVFVIFPEPADSCYDAWSLEDASGKYSLYGGYVSESRAIRRAREVSYEFAWLMDWHPAVALAFLLCGVEPGQVTILMDTDCSPHGGVTLSMDNWYVSPRAVASAYSNQRSEIFDTNERLKGRWPRPRALSLKVRTLLDYVENSPAARWEERLHHWNLANPNMAYKNAKSMSTTYYRAKGIASPWRGELVPVL